MLGAGHQTWPHEFLPEIARRLVDKVSGLTMDRAIPSVWPDDWHLEFPPADKFVTLFMPNFPVDQGDVSGGGLYNTPFDSTLTTTAFIRVESDPEGRSLKQLNEQALGVYTFVLGIVKALHMWNGIEDSGTELVRFRRPMRLMPGFRIERKGGGAGKTRWAIAPISWQVSFVANLGSWYPGGGGPS